VKQEYPNELATTVPAVAAQAPTASTVNEPVPAAPTLAVASPAPATAAPAAVTILAPAAAALPHQLLQQLPLRLLLMLRHQLLQQ
jgi:hypothetical protein